jgi:hypothetical protein
MPYILNPFFVTCYTKGMRSTQPAQARRGRPTTGRAVPAAARMRKMRERRKAAGWRLVTHWQPSTAPMVASGSPSDHRIHDIRSLAMHALVAVKIERDRLLLRVPRRNLQRWRSRFAGPPARWWLEWDRLLHRPWKELSATLTNPDADATRLRQSSPFAGVLTPAERRKLYDAFRT